MEVDWADWAAESCGESRELISIAGISFVGIGNELKIEVGRYYEGAISRQQGMRQEGKEPSERSRTNGEALLLFDSVSFLSFSS